MSLSAVVFFGLGGLEYVLCPAWGFVLFFRLITFNEEYFDSVKKFTPLFYVPYCETCTPPFTLYTMCGEHNNRSLWRYRNMDISVFTGNWLNYVVVRWVFNRNCENEHHTSYFRLALIEPAWVSTVSRAWLAIFRNCCSFRLAEVFCGAFAVLFGTALSFLLLWRCTFFCQMRLVDGVYWSTLKSYNAGLVQRWNCWQHRKSSLIFNHLKDSVNKTSPTVVNCRVIVGWA